MNKQRLVVVSLLLCLSFADFAIPDTDVSTNSAAAEYGYIHIDSETADVMIEKSNSSIPSIVNQTNAEEVTFEKNVLGQSIEIVSKGRHPLVVNPGKIIIRVPSNYDIDANGASSDFTVAEFEGRVLNISSMSGDIKASSVASGRTKFESMSGDIRVTATIVRGMHEFKAMSGDIVVILGANSSVKISAKSEKSSVSINDKSIAIGSLNAIVGKGDATINASTMSGEVDCRYYNPVLDEDNKDSGVKTKEGTATIYFKNGRKIVCEIIKETNETVTVDLGAGMAAYAKSEIARIDRKEE